MASKKIKGITIKFGADTTSLGKALKEIEGTSKSLGSELSDVNRLLKFDPKNTQLLAQKQELLGKQVENTEKKLDALRQTQEEVEKKFKSGDIGAEEYRNFQREIAKTEQDLKSYTIQIDRMESEQKSLKESTKQLQTLFEATGKSLDDFQDILGTKLTNALRNGTANADDMTVALNKIGRAVLGAESDIGKLKSALNQVDDSGIDQVRESINQLKASSDDATDSLEGIKEAVSAGNIIEAADQFSEIGEKIVEIGENAVESFQGMEDATVKVNARFDETGEAAQKNADLIKRVYEQGLGESMDAVANAVILVKDNLKELDDITLENITSQALVLDETYGIDMAESLRGVNGLMQHFGMDAQSAMDMLVAGTQNGLDKTNELGDNLSEYAGKFAEAGYSAEEYFQLLQNGLEGGAYNLDKVNDAINEVTTRLADGSISETFWTLNEETGQLEEGTGKWSQAVKDVFGQWQQGGATQKQVIDAIVTDIQSTENQQDKLNKAALAFGTMAEDGGAKFIESLTSVGDAYTDVDGKAQKLQEDTTTSAQEMEAAMRKVSDAFAPIGEDIAEMITPVLEAVVDLLQWIEELPGPVKTAIEVFAGIAAVVTAIAPVIASIMALNGALVTLTGVGLLPIIGVVAGVAAVITTVIAVIKNWGDITDWLSEKWRAFKDWMSGLWNDISKSASETWDGIKAYFCDLWNSISGTVSDTWENITETLEEVWNGIVDFFRDTWEKIYDAIEAPIKLIEGTIGAVMYAIYAVIYTVWEVIKFALKSAWDWISDTAREIFVPIANFFSETWEKISTTASEIWESVKRNLGNAWNWIKDKASEIFVPVANFFSETWNGIKDTASGVWNSIKDTLGGIWDSIKTKAMDAFSSIWNYIKDGFNDLKNTLGGIVKGIANAIVSPIGNAVNGVIKGVNWVLDAVGSDKKFKLWEIPKFARGTGGIPKDTLGIVNDQKGSTYREMIVPPDGKPFIPEGRDVVLPLKKGTKIMPANQTKSFLEELPHFAKGIGDFFGGIWNSVKEFTGNVWDYISEPSKIVKIAIDKFTDLTGAFVPWITVAKGAVNTVFDSVVGFVKGIFDTQTNIKYNPSAGVEQWRALAARALKMTGQYSEANLTRMLYQMQTESGGNPNAINNWDINAKRGTPSKGLMQVIDPTFRRHAMAGYDKNIYDPLSNMLAAIRYTIARYGSLARGWNGHGYEGGIGNINISDLFPSIPALDIKWFKDGGILTKPALFKMPSGRIGGAGEREAEAIAPLRTLKKYVQDSILEIMGEKDININIMLTTTLDGKELARQQVGYVRPMIKQMDEFSRMLEGRK